MSPRRAYLILNGIIGALMVAVALGVLNDAPSNLSPSLQRSFNDEGAFTVIRLLVAVFFFGNILLMAIQAVSNAQQRLKRKR